MIIRFEEVTLNRIIMQFGLSAGCTAMHTHTTCLVSTSKHPFCPNTHTHAHDMHACVHPHKHTHTVTPALQHTHTTPSSPTHQQHGAQTIAHLHSPLLLHHTTRTETLHQLLLPLTLESWVRFGPSCIVLLIVLHLTYSPMNTHVQAKFPLFHNCV